MQTWTTGSDRLSARLRRRHPGVITASGHLRIRRSALVCHRVRRCGRSSPSSPRPQGRPAAAMCAVGEAGEGLTDPGPSQTESCGKFASSSRQA